MPMRTAFLFSGQGSQYFQMGAPLYEQNQSFKRKLDRLDDLAQDLGSPSILATLYGSQSKAAPFDDIALTTPAIFMVEVALAQTLIESGMQPDICVGASHGTFAASVVSGLLDLEHGMALALRHGRIVQAHGVAGGMVAVLAKPEIFDAPQLRQVSAIASFNYSSHFVVSAKAQYQREIEAFLKAGQHAYQSLAVRYAFHSPWIESVKPHLADRDLSQARATTPLVCCALAKTLDTLPESYFWTVIREPIRFEQTIMTLEREGPFHYLDLGPAGSLATFLKYLLPKSSNSSAKSVITPYGRDNQNLAALMEFSS